MANEPKIPDYVFQMMKDYATLMQQRLEMAYQPYTYKKRSCPIVQIFAEASPLHSGTVVFSTSNSRILKRAIGNIQHSEELFHYFKRYADDVALEYRVEVDLRLPNLYRAFLDSRPFPSFAGLPDKLAGWVGVDPVSGEKVPPDYIGAYVEVVYCTLCKQQIQNGQTVEGTGTNVRHRSCQEEEEEKKVAFDVNMVEALVGFKGWRVDTTKGILITNGWGPTANWIPHHVTVAECAVCPQIPTKRHTCGFYAADSMSEAQKYGEVHGEVYGWGRYVRGEKGWRAQYAYPKSFTINHDQVEHLEILKKYHVPVYVLERLRIYDPKEDGYEYGGDQADGNSRTDSESDSEKD